MVTSDLDRCPDRTVDRLRAPRLVDALNPVCPRKRDQPADLMKPGNLQVLFKRLKGLEPSTFCMASRRSSQLSYSRRDRSSIEPGLGVGTGARASGRRRAATIDATLG